MFCWKCHKQIEISEIHRTTECPLCGSDLHCCRGCNFYSPGNNHDCKESVEDSVCDKEKSNFCDYFRPVKDENLHGGFSDDKAKAATDAFNALFGGGLCL